VINVGLLTGSAPGAVLRSLWLELHVHVQVSWRMTVTVVDLCLRLSQSCMPVTDLIGIANMWFVAATADVILADSIVLDSLCCPCTAMSITVIPPQHELQAAQRPAQCIGGQVSVKVI
jgi:hypothetical protein